jgi:nitric oxide reductase large subunit
MFWFIVPVIIVVAIIAIAVWIIAAKARRQEDVPKKSPDAPTA